MYFISLHQRTPLHVAVERALTEIAKHLVDSGADITIKDYNGVNVYVWSHYGSTLSCKLAIRLGIELHVEFPGWVAITTCEIVEGVVRDCDFVMKLKL